MMMVLELNANNWSSTFHTKQMEHKSTYIQKLPQMIIIRERELLKF